MISYAQNAEDVILARALRDVPKGFYVDVGAASPNEASVTRHFYESGWSGINIEPLPEWATELRQFRPRDRNLEVACAAVEGEFTLFRVTEDPALSTLDSDVAEGHRRGGFHVDDLRIEVRTLDGVLAEYAPPRIDFLKIDVEGAESEVLAGLDLNRWRPRVIVVESTLPTTLVPNHAHFEAYLTAGRYVFASTDGINRYYARAEESETLAPLLVPANATDDYIYLRESLLQDEIVRLRSYVHRLEAELRKQTVALEQERPSDSPKVRRDTKTPPRSLPSQVIQLERVAVCTSPLTAGGKVANLVAQALDAPSALVEHPADLRLDELPDSCVLEIVWPRTEQLRSALLSHGFQIVTIRREPLETLLSYLHLAQVDKFTSRFLEDVGDGDGGLVGATPASDGFITWVTGNRAAALLDISASWAADPAVFSIPYDDFERDPSSELQRFIDLTEIEIRPGQAALLDADGADFENLGPGWRALLPRFALEACLAKVEPIAKKLGFTTWPGVAQFSSDEECSKNWRELLRL